MIKFKEKSNKDTMIFLKRKISTLGTSLYTFIYLQSIKLVQELQYGST